MSVGEKSSSGREPPTTTTKGDSMAATDRPYFGADWREMKTAAEEDREGVLEELAHRTSKGARKLAEELAGGAELANPNHATRQKVLAIAPETLS